MVSAAVPPNVSSGAPPNPDVLIRRLAWGGLVFCLTATGLMFVLTGDWRLSLGVLGGGVLVGISLLAIQSSVDAMIGLMTGASPPVDARRRAAGALVRLVGRYALLGLMAYVMIARLRLHPIGLLIGASSLVASAALEAVRVLTRARTSPH